MGKRSNFAKKNTRGFHPTPPEAVAPLRSHLPRNFRYWEPCAGNGALMSALPGCVRASDIHPLRRNIHCFPATKIGRFGIELCGANHFCTNPPWPVNGGKGDPAISIALHLSDLLPTWLLLPAAFAFNQYMARVWERCVKIVPVGRVSWEGNDVKGKDDCAWYLFDANHTAGPLLERKAA